MSKWMVGLYEDDHDQAFIGVEGGSICWIDDLTRGQAMAIVEAHNALEQRVEGMERGLGEIVEWSKAYPLDVFPEPDFKKAAELLKTGGMTLDAISASNMRHVVKGVGKIAKETLAAEEEA